MTTAFAPPITRLLGRAAHRALHIPSVRLHTTMQTNGAPVRRVRAAALVIGDEILSGSTLDTNTQTLARFLSAHGATLARAETIGDDDAEIAECAKRLSANYDLVFTSGGIGPTLDDRTYGALATAFNLELKLHQPTLQAMTKFIGADRVNDARRRMATLPTPAEVIEVEGLWTPLLVVGSNVHILPGVPDLFARMLSAVPLPRLGGAPPRTTLVVHTRWREGEVAAPLRAALDRFPALRFGSYPATTSEARERYVTKLVIEGDDAAAVADAAAELAAGVQGALVNAA